MSSNYNSTAYTVTSEATPDPWLTRGQSGEYYLTFTAGDRIEIWSGRTLQDFHHPKKSVVWRPPPNKPYSEGVWAPELHALGGRWYVYFAGAQPGRGNPSHRMWVLGGPPASSDPTSGEWQFLGGVKGMPDHWAIDGTVFSLNNQYYIVWSGWPVGDSSDKMQELFIMALSDPITGSSQPVSISRPEHKWEFSDGDHGVNEGPQYLEKDDGGWKGIVYSCAGSWTKDYKLALLTYTGGDPLSKSSWRKEKHPLIENAGQNKSGAFGPGHGSFVHMDGGEIIALFHATDKETDGWGNRKARAQRLTWTRDGPHMGGVVGPMAGDYNQFIAGGPGPVMPGQSGQQLPEKEKSHGLKGLMHKIKGDL